MESSIDVILNVDMEEKVRRAAICSSCEYYTPSQDIQTQIIDAVTGELKTIVVHKFEDCSVDSVDMIDFVSLKKSTCPKDKW